MSTRKSKKARDRDPGLTEEGTDMVARTLYNKQTGELFVPAACFGDPDTVAIAASTAITSGVSLLLNGRCTFVPLSWARREYPLSPWIPIFDREEVAGRVRFGRPSTQHLRQMED
jgi:hypothetical protein